MTIPDVTEHFQDDEHALKTGMFIGVMMKAGIPAAPVTDEDGNYTSRIQIRLAIGPHEPVNVEVEVMP
jgi:hypothetical protein